MSNDHQYILTHLPLHCLFSSLHRLTSKETSKLYITGPLWGESTGDRWIPLTKGQSWGFCFMMSSCTQQRWNKDPILNSILTSHCSSSWVSYGHLLLSTLKMTEHFMTKGIPVSHNECNGVSNHRGLNGLLKRLFRRKSKKTSMLCIIGLCKGNSPVTGEFPSQRASNIENVSIWWHHHGDLSIKPPKACGPLCLLNCTLNDSHVYNENEFRFLRILCWHSLLENIFET